MGSYSYSQLCCHNLCMMPGELVSQICVLDSMHACIKNVFIRQSFYGCWGHA